MNYYLCIVQEAELADDEEDSGADEEEEEEQPQKGGAAPQKRKVGVPGQGAGRQLTANLLSLPATPPASGASHTQPSARTHQSWPTVA